MSAEEPETDEEFVEHARKLAQEVMDRVDFSAASQTEMLNSSGLPQQAVTISKKDLRFIGRFDLVPPPHTRHWPKWLVKTFCRHWVYVTKDGRGTVHALAMQKRLELEALGRTTVWAMIHRAEAD